ncbi:MAG TPA: NADH-ubiquinone oxidoreductase-F iron-sulfur binding region domain-containing protein [Acidimicrobiales bacterium]|nr:NADH-ubiquinone oxidoreductase-F iron-sulfur binding region domain-containing protein [Acidimicrobiales bacterium]
MSAPTGLPRLLAGLGSGGAALSLGDHLGLHGPLPPAPRRRGPDHGLIDVVEASGLRGRGGGGFPTARKLAAVAAGSRRPVVVVNGAEGEPASAKDRLLLARAPHLVLDGAQLAARAVGAAEVVLVVSEAAPELAEGLAAAVDDRRRGGLDRVRPEVVSCPERFVAGEESALVALLNGGAPKPTFVPPRPYQRGVGGRATLIQNVETLAHLALIARHGAGWFRRVGTESEPGSTLVTLGGAVARPGLYEIARGTPMSALLAGVGGATGEVQAYLTGGYGGTWVPAAAARDVGLCDEALQTIGGTLGPGVVVVLPEDACGLAETARLASYLARESAGQCGPCVYGLADIDAALAQVASGRAGSGVVSQLLAWTSQVTGRGACHHPDGAARLVESALRVFRGDLAAHVHGHPCPGTRRPPVLAVPGQLASSGGTR